MPSGHPRAGNKMEKTMKRMSVMLIPLVLLGIGCGDTPQVEDTGVDVNVPDTVQDVVAEDETTPDTMQDVLLDANNDVQGDDGATDATEDLVPYEGGASARVIESAEDLMRGPVAASTIGDILISNKNVRFIVRTQEIGLYAPFGGNVVDADLVREAGDEGHEKFMELFPMIGFGRALKPESIEIVDDGTYSGRAVVRVTGFDHGLSIIDMLIPTTPFNLHAVMDYVLEPDARELTVNLTVTNNAKFEQQVSVGTVVQLGKRFEKFYGHCGELKSCVVGRNDIEWMAGAASDVSIGFTAPADAFPKVMLAEEDLLLTELAAPSLKGGESVSVTAYLIVGSGDVDSVAARAWELRGREGLRTVTGTITIGESLTSMSDVRVTARKSGSTGNLGWVTTARPDNDGNVVMHLPDGLHDLTVSAPGTEDKVLQISVAQNDLNQFQAETNKAGRLHVTVNDGEGNLLPAGIVLKSGLDVPAAVNGEFMTVDGGERNYSVLPGDYTVMAMKGFEYTVMSANATVLPGETTHVMLTLNRVIDTTGMVTVVGHAHAEDSIDSFVTRDDRVHNALAAGIELAMVTDHDRFTTIQPEIEAAGMEGLLKSTVGIEISPLGFHTVGMNCKNPPAYPTYFSIRFGDYDETGYLFNQYTANDLIDFARETYQCQYVGAAHPWEGSALFKYVGLDLEDDPADFVQSLDLNKLNGIELINSNDNMTQLDGGQLAHWFSFLNRGYAITAAGGSDIHGFDMNYGYPLNMVQSSTDVPGDIDVDEVFGNLAAGRSIMYAGPYITVDVNGQTIGDVVDVSADPAAVKLLANITWPSWMHLEFVRIYMNGVLLEGYDYDVTGFDQTYNPNTVNLDVTPAEFTQDTWIVIVAGSASPADNMPGYGRPPISVTNPIYLDVDGDGWEPPGMP